MTESSDDATIVTLNRTREHEQAQASPRVIPYERADFHAVSSALSADIPFPEPAADVPGDAASPSGGGPSPIRTQVSVPAGREAPGAARDDDASFRQVRLGVTAALVVLLVAVWIWQRRNAAAR